MGGKTAMSLALQYPTRVSKLIVADIAPKKYDIDTKFSNIIKGLLHLHNLTLRSRTEADTLLMPFVPELGVRQFLLKNLAWTEQKTLSLRCNIEVLQHRLKEIGAAPTGLPYSGKALFLAGKQSDYVLQTDMTAIQDLFPRASLHWVANAGHWLHAENPKGFNIALQDFLS
jgi:pimeloyl-ACP methyl ester carboxylesterase